MNTFVFNINTFVKLQTSIKRNNLEIGRPKFYPGIFVAINSIPIITYNFYKIRQNVILSNILYFCTMKGLSMEIINSTKQPGQ